jgi:hypothetical protein
MAGMPDFRSAGLAPLLSHATARPDELARRSKARPQAAGRRFESQLIGPLNATAETATPTGVLQSGGYSLVGVADQAKKSLGTFPIAREAPSITVRTLAHDPVPQALPGWVPGAGSGTRVLPAANPQLKTEWKSDGA